MVNTEYICTCIKQEFNFHLPLSTLFGFLFCTFVWSRSLFSYSSTDEMLKQQTQNSLYSSSSQRHRFVSFIHSFTFTRIYISWHTISVSACMSMRTVWDIYIYISVQIWCAFWGILYCIFLLLFYFSLKLFKWMGENEAITTYSQYTTHMHNILNT